MLEYTEETKEVAVLLAPTPSEKSEMSEAEWQSLVKKVTQEAKSLKKTSRKAGWAIGAKVFPLYLVIMFVLEFFMLTLLPDSITKVWIPRTLSFILLFFWLGGFALWSKRIKSLKAEAVTELISTGNIHAIPVLLDTLKAHHSLVFAEALFKALLQLLPALNKSNRGFIYPEYYPRMLAMIKGRDQSLDQDFTEAWIRAMERIEYVEAIPVLRRIARMRSQNKHLKAKYEVLSQAAQEVLPGLEAVASREKAEKVLLRPSQPEATGETLLRPVSPPVEDRPETLLRPHSPEGEDKPKDTDNS